MQEVLVVYKLQIYLMIAFLSTVSVYAVAKHKQISSLKSRLTAALASSEQLAYVLDVQSAENSALRGKLSDLMSDMERRERLYRALESEAVGKAAESIASREPLPDEVTAEELELWLKSLR